MGITQLIGGAGAVLLWTVLVVANVDVLASFGSDKQYLATPWGNLTTQHALGSLGLAIELLFIGAVYGVARWWSGRKYLLTLIAVVVAAGCAGVSWHSAKTWLQVNIATVQAPATQSQVEYGALQNELLLKQEKVDWLLGTSTSKMNRRERAEHKAEIAAAEKEASDLRAQLISANLVTAPKPVEGFEVYAATMVVLVSILSWFAVFGSAHPGRGDTPQVTAGDTPHVTPGVTTGDTASVTPVTPPLVTPEKPNAINAVTPESPLPVTPAVNRVTPPPVTPSVTPPPDPPSPAVTPPPSPGVVVTLADYAVPAVRRWVRSQDDGDPAAFLLASEALESYLASGGPDMTRDDFFKAMKEVVGTDRCVRKKAGRGYVGLKLRAKVRATATT